MCVGNGRTVKSAVGIGMGVLVEFESCAGVVEMVTETVLVGIPCVLGIVVTSFSNTVQAPSRQSINMELMTNTIPNLSFESQFVDLCIFTIFAIIAGNLAVSIFKHRRSH